MNLERPNEDSPQTNQERAQKIMTRYVLVASAVTLVFIPVLDVALLSSIQLKMLHSLADVYEVEFSDQLGKSLLAALVGSTLPVSFSMSVIKIARFFSLYSFIIGSISASLFSSASTYALGKVFIQHFEMGGTLLNFNPDQVKAYYAEMFDEGKQNFTTIKP